MDLLCAIGGVEIDENRADPRRGVLDQHPLGVIRAPDADPIAGVDPMAKRLRASASTFESNSPYVRRTFWYGTISASRSGNRRAVSLRF